MANALYAVGGREGYLGGTNDWNSNDIRLVFVDEADDTINLTTDDFLDDRAAPSRVAVSASTMTSLTITQGTADAADHTIATVTGDQFESIDIYEHTGTDGTSSLIANIDTATGLPSTPGGGDITVRWDAAGIFTL